MSGPVETTGVSMSFCPGSSKSHMKYPSRIEANPY